MVEPRTAHIIRLASPDRQVVYSVAMQAQAERTAGSSPDATEIVRSALTGSGIELVASCGVDVYDGRAPAGFRSADLLEGCRGVVVAASAGPELWRRMRVHLGGEPLRSSEAHPLDAFVAGLLTRVDGSLTAAGVRFRRFEPTLTAVPRLDFMALGGLVGLGCPGPFGMLIHPQHGSWWALRAAWLVAAEVEPPLAVRRACANCPAPCLPTGPSPSLLHATVEVRSRCIVGAASRYDDDQIAYHYDVARLRTSKEG
ncbi:MAG: hypothetical protein M3O36_10965 [Myxococcota bacterium]|nr:hypothetical protein [Myxococcota bacterium]